MTKAETRAILKGKDLKGYTWAYFDKGHHVFTRRIDDYKSPLYGKYEILKALDEDLTNGNIEYFCENGWNRP